LDLTRKWEAMSKESVERRTDVILTAQNWAQSMVGTCRSGIRDNTVTYSSTQPNVFIIQLTGWCFAFGLALYFELYERIPKFCREN